jgi:hypothetical protein
MNITQENHVAIRAGCSLLTLSDSVSIYSHPHESTIIDGSTYWSDSVYLSYNRISAWCGTERPVGRTHSGSIISLRSDQLYSSCGEREFPYTGRIYPFNFADLEGPIPFSAWNCEDVRPIDFEYRTEWIYDHLYMPRLLIPQHIRELDPDWSTCNVGLYGRLLKLDATGLCR